MLAERVPDPTGTAPPLAWRLAGEAVPDPRATEYLSEPWASEALFSLFLPCTLQPIVEADAQKVYI